MNVACCWQAIKRFAATLSDADAGRDDKALALRFAVHIIADLLNLPAASGRPTRDRIGLDA